MNSQYSHWAVCNEQGGIVYDPQGRAEIFDSKARAIKRIMKITQRENRVLHAERVEIR